MTEAADFDTSQLEEYIVRENELVMLGFAGGNVYIPVKVIGRVETPFLYDPIAEGQLSGPIAGSTSSNGVTSLPVQVPIQNGSTNLPGKPPDVFDLTHYPDIFYQVFIGADPLGLRVLIQQPYRVDQKVLPVVGHTTNYFQAGYIDARMSRLTHPDPKSMCVVAPGISLATGYVNSDPQQAYPLLMFWINACRCAVVTDPQLVKSMIDVDGMAKYLTVGGIQTYPYDPKSYYGIAGVQLDYTLSEIEAGLRFNGKPAVGTRSFI
jgi:hypothetical protein